MYDNHDDWDNCWDNCCQCYIGSTGPRGLTGPAGATGATGPVGPTGSFSVSSYMTAKATVSTVSPNDKIVFGGAISSSGNNITHEENTSEFTLAGGHTYFIQFSVNGLSQEKGHGFFFALMVGNFITDSRVASQNIANDNAYNSGSAYYFREVRANTTAVLQVINIGLDTIGSVNANISILQISN